MDLQNPENHEQQQNVLKQTSKTNEKGGTQSLPAVSLKIPCGWSSIKDEAKGWWFPVQFYYPILPRFFWRSRWLHCNAVLWPWPFFLDPSDWKGPRPIVFWSAGTQPLSCWWTWDLSLSWFIYVYLLFIWTSYEHHMNTAMTMTKHSVTKIARSRGWRRRTQLTSEWTHHGSETLRPSKNLQLTTAMGRWFPYRNGDRTPNITTTTNNGFTTSLDEPQLPIAPFNLELIVMTGPESRNPSTEVHVNPGLIPLAPGWGGTTIGAYSHHLGVGWSKTPSPRKYRRAPQKTSRNKTWKKGDRPSWRRREWDGGVTTASYCSWDYMGYL